MDKRQKFWKIRSANYDKLFWTKDASYLDVIIKCVALNKDDLVLDVGCGTGAVTKAIKPYARHVVGIDISDAMLSKGSWEGISLIKCDISEHIFANTLFDKITARMIFHHILDNIDRAFIRCYDLLKPGGRLIIAEGIPPSDNDAVVKWYTDMFKIKEERRTFKSNEIAYYMKKNGFVDISQTIHIMKNFSVRNWLINSNLPKAKQDKIMRMHTHASPKIKKNYNMKITGDDCLIATKNIIVMGNRPPVTG